MDRNSLDTPQTILTDLIERCVAEIDEGRSIDIDAIAASHPEHADEIRRTLGMLVSLEDLDPVKEGMNVSKEDRVHSELGDFKLIRELGRGGMGVVYEAVQRSVRRRVAIKVLPFAALADPAKLQRFKNEVRAAGILHHPNIVPVYSVGVERGVHYFAMQLIDGPSLSEVIVELSGQASGQAMESTQWQSDQIDATPDEKPATDPRITNSPLVSSSNETAKNIQASVSTIRSRSSKDYQRQVAQWGVQVASALGCAHDMGILHRDIKPGNLLLDQQGKLWVTDFGLARIESQATVTMTGDILGTLRYMAPEQLRAKRGLIDHRADIYALGATLYELLTLQPLFRASGRSDLVQQVLHQEPASMATVCDDIAPELQSIVAKSLSKEPSERYQSAQELGDELTRFLESKPILTKPPGSLGRVVKWFRRHPAISATVTASLLILLLVSGSFVVALSQANHETARQKNQVIAERNEAVRQRDEASSALQLAIAALDEFYGEVGAQWINDDRQLSDYQYRMLERSAELLTEIANRYPSGEDSAAQAGLCFVRAGKAMQRMADLQPAKQFYQQAISKFQLALEANYNPKEIKNELASAERRLGEVMVGLGEHEQADLCLKRSRTLYEELATKEPEAQKYRLQVMGMRLLQLKLMSIRLQDEQLLRSLEELREETSQILAGNDKWFGGRLLQLQAMQLESETLRRLGRAEEAVQACRVEAVAGHLHSHRDVRRVVRTIASVRAERGIGHLELGEWSLAEADLQLALEQVRRSFLFDGTPKEMYVTNTGKQAGYHLIEPEAYTLYACIQSRLAQLSMEQGRQPQALELMFEATATCHTEFMAANEKLPNFAIRQMQCCLAVAETPLPDAKPQLRQLAEMVQRSLSSMDVVMKSGAAGPREVSDLAELLVLQGHIRMRQEKASEAQATWKRAAALQSEVADRVGTHPMVEKRLERVQQLVLGQTP